MIEIKDTNLPIAVAEKIITGTKPYNATPLTKAIAKAVTGYEKADTEEAENAIGCILDLSDMRWCS